MVRIMAHQEKASPRGHRGAICFNFVSPQSTTTDASRTLNKNSEFVSAVLSI